MQKYELSIRSGGRGSLAAPSFYSWGERAMIATNVIHIFLLTTGDTQFTVLTCGRIKTGHISGILIDSNLNDSIKNKLPVLQFFTFFINDI